MFIELILFTLSVVACAKCNACSFLVVFPFLQSCQIDLILRNQIVSTGEIIFCFKENKYFSVLLWDLCGWIFNMAGKKVPFKYKSIFCPFPVETAWAFHRIRPKQLMLKYFCCIAKLECKFFFPTIYFSVAVFMSSI